MQAVSLIITILISICNRVKILNLLGEFHNNGRLHLSDFDEGNVVERNGNYRLIDFHDFIGHSCDWSSDMDWRVGDFWFDARRSLPCDILGEVGDEMGIWDDCKLLIVCLSTGTLINCSSQPRHRKSRSMGGSSLLTNFRLRMSLTSLCRRTSLVYQRTGSGLISISDR